MGTIPKAPCRYCEEREVGCHSKCEKYQEYYRDNEKFKAEKLKRKEEEYITRYYVKDNKRRMKGK